MIEKLFVSSLGGVLLVLFSIGFWKLPQERWQIIAAIPHRKEGSTQWRGINFTFYGFFNATALVIAISVWALLLASMGFGAAQMAAMGIPLVGICFLSSRAMARWIEKKRHTATIGGASFVILLLSPWLIEGMGKLFPPGPESSKWIFPILAAVWIAYSLGEGIGRLACISFGCCYGKPLDQCPAWLGKFFSRFHFIFWGKTKKIAYAHGWEGRPVVPVQGLTAVLSSGAALFGIYFFLKGHYGAAFWTPLVITQAWRFLSEFLRADFRGGGKLSAYQWMAMLSIPYGFSLAAFFPLPPPQPIDLLGGLRSLWTPAHLLFIEVLWGLAFFLTGRSFVTGATLSFHVLKEKI